MSSNIIRLPSENGGEAIEEPGLVLRNEVGQTLAIVEEAKTGRLIELWHEGWLVCMLTRDNNGIWIVSPPD